MEQSTQHPDVLAARRALSRPHAARLLVGGNGTPVHGVELIDRHGTPVLVCDPGSALAQASRDRRTATLTLVGDPELPVVVMRGRLSPLSADRIEDRDVELVELVLADVAVGDHGPLDLADYLQEPPEILERYVADVLAHSNADHGAQLRGFAARVSGAPAASIA
ncbi:MAG: hypothetical protein JWO46_96, partial [Nocardioidaceae bacterium]|nr:hypothetical protein [Nocardioidaceae bacterium]